MSKYGEIVKTDAELKPCPFCGGKGYIIMAQNRFYATCDTCTCRVAGPLERESTVAEVVTVWNRRNGDHVEAMRYNGARLLEIEKNLNDIKNILRFWSNSVRQSD